MYCFLCVCLTEPNAEPVVAETAPNKVTQQEHHFDVVRLLTLSFIDVVYGISTVYLRGM